MSTSLTYPEQLATIALHAAAGGCDDPEPALAILAAANHDEFNRHYGQDDRAPTAADIAAAQPIANATPISACSYLCSLCGNTDPDVWVTNREAFGQLGRAVLLATAQAGEAGEPVARLFRELCRLDQGPAQRIVTALAPRADAEPEPMPPAARGELDVALPCGGGAHASGRTDRRARIVPGRSITLYGTVGPSTRPVAVYHPNGQTAWAQAPTPAYNYRRTFRVGDTAERDSHNLTYTDPIGSIGAKTVTVGRNRLTVETFDYRNWDLDLAEIHRRNGDTLAAV